MQQSCHPHCFIYIHIYIYTYIWTHAPCHAFFNPRRSLPRHHTQLHGHSLPCHLHIASYLDTACHAMLHRSWTQHALCIPCIWAHQPWLETSPRLHRCLKLPRLAWQWSANGAQKSDADLQDRAPPCCRLVDACRSRLDLQSDLVRRACEEKRVDSGRTNCKGGRGKPAGAGGLPPKRGCREEAERGQLGVAA